MTEIMTGKETVRDPRFVGVSVDGPHTAKSGIHEGDDYMAIRGEALAPEVTDNGLVDRSKKAYYPYDAGVMQQIEERIADEGSINVY
jgi:hypothetical protein